MHNDGLVFFPFSNGDDNRGLIVQNHEYTDDDLLFPDGSAVWTADKTKKSLAAHGVSVIEVRRRGRRCAVGDQAPVAVRPSHHRLHADDRRRPGRRGPTPAHERRPDRQADPRDAQQLRDGIHAVGDVPRLRGELQRLLPDDRRPTRRLPEQAAVRHQRRRIRVQVVRDRRPLRSREGAERVQPLRVGRGDRSVRSAVRRRSSAPRSAASSTRAPGSRKMSTAASSCTRATTSVSSTSTASCPTCRGARRGRRRISPLDDGILYVARFSDDGTGEWLELSPNNPALAGWSLADIMINTRTAADLVGATPMDRPEWIDTFPDSLTAIATLTNNSRRGTPGQGNGRLDPTSRRPASDAINKRSPNPYGQILSWTYQSAFSEPTFRWDVFAYAGDPAIPAHRRHDQGRLLRVAGRALRLATQPALDPDRRRRRRPPRQPRTRSSTAEQGFGNNMMLCADPITRSPDGSSSVRSTAK